MKIVLYQNIAESIRVDKANYLTEVLSLEGTLREECSVLQPQILVQLTELPHFNYAYIEEFNRYYYVDTVVSVRNNLWRIALSEDVLYSNRELILNTSCIVSRSASDYNPNLVDVVLPIEGHQTYEYYTISNEFPFTKGLKGGYFTTSYVVETVTSLGGILNSNDVVDGSDLIRNLPNNLSPIDKTLSFRIFDYPDALNKVYNEINTSETKRSYLVSIRQYPFNISDLFTVGDASEGDYQLVYSRDFYIGSETIEVPVVTENNRYTGMYEFYRGNNCLKYTIKKAVVERKYGDWRDFSPYTKIEFFIPFYGYVEIDPVYCYNDNYNFSISFTIDLSNGVCRVDFITNNQLVKSVSFEIGQPLPISGTNEYEVEMRSKANKISLATGIVGTVAQTAGRIATFGLSYNQINPQKAVQAYADPVGMAGKSIYDKAMPKSTLGAISGSGAAGIIGAIGSYFANEVTNLESGSVVNCDSVYLSYITTLEVFARVTRMNSNADYDKFKEYYGAPLREVKKLSDLSGFTLIEYIYISGENLLKDEAVTLEELCMSGIII